jgi:hypothetical protein
MLSEDFWKLITLIIQQNSSNEQHINPRQNQTHLPQQHINPIQTQTHLPQQHVNPPQNQTHLPQQHINPPQPNNPPQQPRCLLPTPTPQPLQQQNYYPQQQTNHPQPNTHIQKPQTRYNIPAQQPYHPNTWTHQQQQLPPNTNANNGRTYATVLRKNPNPPFPRQTYATIQKRNPIPHPPTRQVYATSKTHTNNQGLIPDEYFQLFKLLRSYSNNRHSHRLFLQDLDKQQTGHSRNEQRQTYTVNTILGLKLHTDHSTEANVIKQKINQLTSQAYELTHTYYEDSFMETDKRLTTEIQHVLTTFTKTQIDSIANRIIQNIKLSIDKRRFGRNYRFTVEHEILDILAGAPGKLRTMEVIYGKTQHIKEIRREIAVQTNDIPVPIQQYPSQNTVERATQATTDTVRPMAHRRRQKRARFSRASTKSSSSSTTYNSKIQRHIAQSNDNSTTCMISDTSSQSQSASESPSQSNNSTASPTFHPSRWQSTPIKMHTSQTASSQTSVQTQLFFVSAPTERIENPPATTPTISHSAPLDIIPSSQLDSTTIHVIDLDSEPSQTHTPHTLKENKIQQVQNATLQFKHYSTNIADIKMPSTQPALATNPFKFNYRENFIKDLTQHIDLFQPKHDDTILITITCSNNTPLDSIHTDILIQPTPPSQFFSNATKIDTLFNCINKITQPKILELIFTQTPTSNFLWHHFYKNTASTKTPIIISTPQEILPLIKSSHCNLNISSNHDTSILSGILAKQHFLQENPHFLSQVPPGTHGD